MAYYNNEKPIPRWFNQKQEETLCSAEELKELLYLLKPFYENEKQWKIDSLKKIEQWKKKKAELDRKCIDK